jgi:hypothetical protein
VLWQYVLQSVVCVLGAERRVTLSQAAQHPVHPVQRCIFTHNSTKTVTLARFRRMLPDYGPNGPKHVGAV